MSNCPNATEVEKEAMPLPKSSRILQLILLGARKGRTILILANRSQRKQLHGYVTQNASKVSINATVADGSSSMDVSDRCDDGADDSVASLKIANERMLNGIGKITKIEPVIYAGRISSE